MLFSKLGCTLFLLLLSALGLTVHRSIRFLASWDLVPHMPHLEKPVLLSPKQRRYPIAQVIREQEKVAVATQATQEGEEEDNGDNGQDKGDNIGDGEEDNGQEDKGDNGGDDAPPMLVVPPELSLASRNLQLHVKSANQAQQQSAPLNYKDVLGKTLSDEEHALLMLPKNSTKEQKDAMLKAFKRERSTRVRNSKTNGNRTAIVWVCRYLDECGAQRLKHLLTTAGATPKTVPTTLPNGTSSTTTIPSNTDVWILYNHKSLIKKKQQRKLHKSEKLLSQLKQYAQSKLGIKLRGAHQSEKSLPLDGPRSGSGKSSFLKFMVHAQYQYGWHIEDDVFFTGPWKTVFDNFEANNWDVIATGDPAPQDWYHFASRPCTVSVPVWAEFNQQRMFLPAKCQQIAPHITRWAAMRMSLRFAESLLELSRARAVIGHHEAIVAAMCRAYHYECDSHSLLQPYNGHICTAGWGQWENASTQVLELHGTIHPNQLYHPVKCAAYKENLTGLTNQLVY